MRISVALASENNDTDVENIINLKARVSENIDTAIIKQQQQPLRPDDAAGGVLGAILDIVVGQDVIKNLIDTVREWIKSRPAVIEAKKSKLEIVVEDGSGKKTTIRVENMKDLEKIQNLAESAGA